MACIPRSTGLPELKAQFVASRVVSLAGGFSDEGPYYLTGGLCDNRYFIELVGRLLDSTVSSRPNARFAEALEAAERALAI